MISSHNHEQLKVAGENWRVLTPVGLGQFALGFVSHALRESEADGQDARVRVVPVSDYLEHDAALFSPKKNYLQINVSLVELRYYLRQKALVNLEMWSARWRGPLAHFDATMIRSLWLSSACFEESLGAPQAKPRWMTCSQEKYNVTRDYDIVELAIDVYLAFVARALQLVTSGMSAEQQARLVSFVRMVADDLHSITDEEVAQTLSTLTVLPDSYTLASILANREPLSTDAARNFQLQLHDSVKHEWIHRIFNQCREPRVIERLRALFMGGRSEHNVSFDAEKLYAAICEREIAVYEALTDFIQGTRDEEEMISVFMRINADTLTDVLRASDSEHMRNGPLMRAYLVGIEEVSIALLSAQVANKHYLQLLAPYINDPKFLMPSGHLIRGLQEIVAAKGQSLRATIAEISARYCTLDACDTYGNKLRATPPASM